MEAQIKKRLIIFTVIALGCGWFGKLVDLLLVDQPEDQSLGSLLWLVVPFLLSLFLAWSPKSKLRSIGLKPRFQENTRWYLLSFVVFPIVAILILGVGILVNSVDTSNFEFGGFGLTLIMMFSIHFFRAILEEVAWRGLLQERLIQCNFSDWHIYIISAFIWSTWHIPYYLFFLDSKSAMTMILSNYLMIFSWNLIFTEVYKKTRSIWPCVILHATTNAIQFVMLEDYLVLDHKTEVLLSPATGILACGLYLVSGCLIRKYRIHSNSLNTVN